MTSTSLSTAPGAQRRSAVRRRRHLPRSRSHPARAARRPVFEDDVWDFTDVIGLPVQMALSRRRFDFTAITDPRWRLVAKELILALLAPRTRRWCAAPRLPDRRCI